MFLNNKYTNYYNSIINRAKSRIIPKEIYSESHHIIPRSLGGANSKNNLVSLTAREHRLAHILLTKMLTEPEHIKKMWYAAWMVLRVENINQNRHISKGKFYELAKINFSSLMSVKHKGKIVSAETRKKISDARKGMPSPNKGKAMSKEQKQKMRDTIAINGRIISPDTVKKILESRKDYKHSEETKKKISESNKGKTRPPCSEEQKKVVSEKLKGRIISAETKQKMADARKAYWDAKRVN